MINVLEMLTYMRPAGSKAEDEFRERFIGPFNPATMAKNLVIVVPGGTSETLFSCHTDTVHWKGGRQKIMYDKEMNAAFKDDKQPLGADDTAGVWMLLKMIEAKKPGTYMFHYGEEKGCIGSRQMAKEFGDYLRKFKRAIAFDRRGTTSIITFQMSNRCCSDGFAVELAKRLGNGFAPDNTGLYTDTASYIHLIPECTNVSVGYSHEHSPEEMLDIEHLEMLARLAIDLDWDTLPTERKPDDESVRDKPVRYYGNSGWNGGHDYERGSSYGNRYGGQRHQLSPAASLLAKPIEPIVKKRQPVPLPEGYEDEVDWLIEAGLQEGSSFEKVQELIRDDPEYAATVLYAFVCRELKAEQKEFAEAHGAEPENTDEVAAAEIGG